MKLSGAHTLTAVRLGQGRRKPRCPGPLTRLGALALAAAVAAIGLAPAPASAAGTKCAKRVAYPGDNAPKGAIANWMAHGARARGLPGELPVMASLVESGLRNIGGGDRDSVGFFQMRVGIWNTGDYAGFPDHPQLQLKWFGDQAIAARARHVAGGDVDYGRAPSSWGEWDADVIRPPEQYRGRYQLRLDEARQLIGRKCRGFPRRR